MKRTLVVLTVIGMLQAQPSLAAKDYKQVTGHFVANAPVSAACMDYIDGVTSASHPFRAPARGVLSVVMNEFEGDWDLVVRNKDGGEIGSSADTQPLWPAREEVVIPLDAGQKVSIVACNYLNGQQGVDVRYSFAYGF